MSRSLIHRLRPVLIGLIVLALSAGAVLAVKPSSLPADGKAVASEAAGKTVPVANQNQAGDDEDKQDEEPAEETAGEPSNDNCATDPRTLTEEQLAELTHGQIVCWAAHQETPAEYKNHGEWVSEWARQGKEPPNPNSHAAKGLSKKP